MAEQQKLCTICGTVGNTKRSMKGSILTELFLWLFFLVPGLIYSIWRHTTVAQVCRNCGSPAVIPLDSPVARQMLASRGATGEAKAEAKPRAAMPVPRHESPNRFMYKAGQAWSNSPLLRLAAVTFGILIGFVVVGAIVGQAGKSSSSSVSGADASSAKAEELWEKGTHTVSAETTWGAVDEADLALLLRAARNDDKAGFEAMVADGRVYSIPKGTKVDVFYMKDGIAKGFIESGSLNGRELFIPYHTLTKD